MVQSQQLNSVTRNVKNCLRGNETKLCSCIIRDDTLHDDIVGGDTTVECNSLRNEREELSGGHCLSSNPLVVETIPERNLNGCGASRLCWGRLIRGDSLG